MDASQRKKILLIIAWSFGFLLLLAIGWMFYFDSQFSVYQDSQYKFSIEYPKTWKVVVHPKQDVAVVFLRPKDTVMDTLQENFNVTIQPIPDDISTLGAFSAAIKRQMTGVFGKSIIIVEDKSIQLSEREGHEMALNAPNPDHLKLLNAWLFANNRVYILTFLGDMYKYTDDLACVHKMIHSLHLR